MKINSGSFNDNSLVKKSNENKNFISGIGNKQKKQNISEGFLPPKSHPIGDEIKQYYIDNSGEVPERIHYEVRDANEPLPFERVRQLLVEINQSANDNPEDFNNAQKAPLAESVLKLLS